MERVSLSSRASRYDLCALTGDYRGKTWGPYEAALSGVARVRAALRGKVYGVLGNHDTIRMAPDLERMGIRILLNEQVEIEREGASIFLAGVDDAHFYRVDNLEKAAWAFRRRFLHSVVAYARNLSPGGACRFRSDAFGAHAWRPDLPARRRAADAGFGLAWRMGRGGWRYGEMAGYTSAGSALRCSRSFQLPARNHLASP